MIRKSVQRFSEKIMLNQKPMTRLQPSILFGGEARYFRKYEGIGLERFAGEALFVGPTAYFQLSGRSRLTIAWSVQAWRRLADRMPRSTLQISSGSRRASYSALTFR
jgi:hypothetical protein